MPSWRSGIPIFPRVGGCHDVRQPLAGLGKVRIIQNFGRLPGSVFPSSLRPMQGELGHRFRPLAESFSLAGRPLGLCRFRLHLAPLLLIWLLPSLTSPGQSQPLPPASALAEQAASPALLVAPPPLGAAALLGPEPLSIGGDPIPAAPSPLPLPLAPAALEGPSGPSPGAAPAPSLAPSPTAAAAATPAPAARATVAPPASPSAPPATAPSPAATGPATPLDRALILDRQRRLLSLLENGRLVRRFPVAVGMPGWETPVGRFQVLNKTENPVWEHPEKGTHTPAGPANPLGSRWIGFHQDCLGRRGWDGPSPTAACVCMRSMCGRCSISYRSAHRSPCSPEDRIRLSAGR
jgi:hypothetical protein